IQDFDDPNDSTFWGVVNGDNATDATRMDMTFQTDNAVEGSAVSVDWLAEDSESWGGFVKFENYAPDSMVYDWSAYDTVSFWYYNQNPQTTVGDVHVRFNLYEASDVPDTTSNSNDMEFYYSFHYTILDDSTSEWHKISIPLIAGGYWDGEGFNRTGWSGVAGNEKLDTDKIKGYCFEFSIGGGGDFSTSEGIVLFDQLELSGLAEDPWLIFNGKTVNSDFTQFTWGQSALEIVEGGGIDPKTNSLLWTMGDEWANGWSGAGWNVDPARDLGFRWGMDSVKFALKADAGTNSPLRFQFESANGIRGMAFEIVADDQWHDYALNLSDFYVIDDKPDFDSTAITVIQMMGEGNAIAGQKVYWDFIWTGNPVIDVVPPEAPTSVAGIAGTYQNLITWVDVPNEEGAGYTVLYSTNAITSVDDEGLEVLATVGEGIQFATHVITAPLVDTELSYYYAVYAVDAAGNLGPLAATDAIANTAKGVATIAPAFTGFAADGDLSEWADIMPIRMYVSDGSGAIVTNTTIDNDADLSLDAWVGFDENYLYFAADVEDDVIDIDSTDGETWMRDGVDLFIGLFNQSGAKHTSYQKGEEPDLHFRFSEHQLLLDISGGGVLSKKGVDYYWKEKFGTGYIVEGRVSLDTLAVKLESTKFKAVVGMKIPIDYAINDADGARREGIMTLSKINEDQSWANPSLWTHTWIGDKMTDVNGNADNMVNTYALSQNYPNPFNPSTVINYSIAEAGMVSLKIYNILGQEVMSLVNSNQNVGQYQVKFDASQLSTGLYIYRIQAGNFVDSKKMMLLK
ncbi:MAG: T9SS type A sorting domain-containing protein, partial [Melioribacteraceae bacterium]|nr:T9SS type A sorting domain-containing protein [Melioribacteraceae bacterium]